MKELSIEEKAKRFDTMFIDAKDMYHDGLACSQPVKEVLSTLFPELKESEDERIRKWIRKELESKYVVNNIVNNEIADKALAWLEKQGKQEQLYIRFGEIPTDEKSKIFQGEIEVGTENGVSVYPAFKTSEGDIVLGLNLPITKTTLYTQQHLIEYDDRPCYLVKGDYVGKDTDGQPLINNVSIIEKIDTYRAREKKQREQNPTDKVKPKFHEGDFILNGDVTNDGKPEIFRVLKVCDTWYDVENIYDSRHTIITFKQECSCRVWNTIEDAKDGDVLSFDNEDSNYHGIGIFKRIASKNELNGNTYRCYVRYGGFKEKLEIPINGNELHHCGTSVHPATKEQRETLMKAMADAGYEWDAEKKEPKKIEQQAAEKLSKEQEYTLNRIVEYLEDNNCPEDWKDLLMGIHDAPCIKQKPAWSEEDETRIKSIIALLKEPAVCAMDGNKGIIEASIKYLKSLKNRVLPQPNPSWSEEDYNEIETIACHLDNIGNEGMAEVLLNIRDKYNHIIPQSTWKPSNEQMEVLNWCKPLWNEPKTKAVLESLIEDLKKLREE